MGISAHDREIQLLVNDVKEGHLRLPELQRRYVWKSTQVRDFFDSLYHQYPTGQLLVWETDDQPHARRLSAGGIDANHRRPQLLLDGQQRLTSLYAVMTGQPLVVRDKIRTIDIVFNVFSQIFEVATAFHSTQKGWVSVTKLFTKGLLPLFNDLKLDYSSPQAQEALNNLTRMDAVKNYRYRITVLDGLLYDEVTDIFVRINSGGTRLAHADLALAQISSRWRGVTKELDQFHQKAKALGWDLDDSILLRVLSAVATNQTRLSQFFTAGRSEELTEAKLRGAWERAKPAIIEAIHFVKQNCLIDRPDMLTTDYVLVPLAVFFDRHGTNVTPRQMRELQRWLYMALIWARYSGPSETSLDQDVTALGKDDPIKRMVQNIEDKVGPGRRVTERELQDELSNSPFMVMAYVLARRNNAQDWFHGVALGPGQDLEYHHVFPKALLNQRFKDRSQSRVVNQIANLAFLSQRANARIAASSPDAYLPTVQLAFLQAQYVPTDPGLWTLDRYEDFARERRKLLANAINYLLASLMDEPAPWVDDLTKQLEARVGAAEEELRALIEQRLSSNFGPRGWERCVPNDIKEAVGQRIEQRVKRNPFEAGQHDALGSKLEQCQFGDYATIIRTNWSLFEDVFRNRAAFDRQMLAVQEARNAIAHHRAMNEGEQHMAAGGLYWLEQCLRAARAADESDEAELEDEALATVGASAKKA